MEPWKVAAAVGSDPPALEAALAAAWSAEEAAGRPAVRGPARGTVQAWARRALASLRVAYGDDEDRLGYLQEWLAVW